MEPRQCMERVIGGSETGKIKTIAANCSGIVKCIYINTEGDRVTDEEKIRHLLVKTPMYIPPCPLHFCLVLLHDRLICLLTVDCRSKGVDSYIS